MACLWVGVSYRWNPINGAISWEDPTQIPPSAKDSTEVASREGKTTLRVNAQEEAHRLLREVVEDTETSENDLRVALDRLNPRARTPLKKYEHRIV